MFTYNAESFADCQSIIMAVISDHNIITFNITDTTGEHKDFKNSNTPNILKYNINIFFFYQTTIIAFLQTNSKNKKFIKKQLTKHYITLLPFVILKQEITKSTDTLVYSKYFRCNKLDLLLIFGMS